MFRPEEIARREAFTQVYGNRPDLRRFANSGRDSLPLVLVTMDPQTNYAQFRERERGNVGLFIEYAQTQDRFRLPVRRERRFNSVDYPREKRGERSPVYAQISWRTPQGFGIQIKLSYGGIFRDQPTSFEIGVVDRTFENAQLANAKFYLPLTPDTVIEPSSFEIMTGTIDEAQAFYDILEKQHNLGGPKSPFVSIRRGRDWLHAGYTPVWKINDYRQGVWPTNELNENQNLDPTKGIDYVPDDDRYQYYLEQNGNHYQFGRKNKEDRTEAALGFSLPDVPKVADLIQGPWKNYVQIPAQIRVRAHGF